MTDGQGITNPREMFEWASSHIKGIHFEFISSADITDNSTYFKLPSKYENVYTGH